MGNSLRTAVFRAGAVICCAITASGDVAGSLREAGVDSLVFATRGVPPDGHWYANISYYADDAANKTYVAGSGLYRLDLAAGSVTPLLEDTEGTVRDPAVHYNGEDILFSYRRGGTGNFLLYTIHADGTGLRQITFGDYDDIEPAWLPDGGIVFVSSRCRRWVNCWLTQVATIHRCDADGGNIRPLSANLEQDNTPWPLPDGRILYMRWEYVDRSQVDYHHLWTMNPDGTNQQVYYGNMHPGSVYLDAKPIPGTPEVLMVNSPGHGRKEHTGKMAIVTPKKGPDAKDAVTDLTGEGFHDPYPITRELFIAAKDRGIYAFGRDGKTTLLFAFGEGNKEQLIHEPRPLRARTRERVIPPRIAEDSEEGYMVLADVCAGRNMDGVDRGEVERLLVVESLPKPINYTGGMDPLTYGGSFTLERILGTVPVEIDGSANFRLPAGRSFFFIALDAEGNAVKRMQSFTSVMPGETTSCVGCHEPRTQTATNPGQPQLRALLRPPSTTQPIAGIPDVFDFPRDIQPILDKHCVACHDYTRHDGVPDGPRAGGVILTGDHGPIFSQSYVNLTVHGQFADGRDQARSNLPPRSIGAGASPIMDKLKGAHHGVVASPAELDMVRYWIETGATYPGTYGALGGGAIGGYYQNNLVETGEDWPSAKPAAEAIRNRCGACHAEDMSLPKSLADENELSFWRPDWSDPRLVRTRHFLFNLSRPEYSLMLLAPLAKEAGGYGLCTAESGAPVFANRDDPDYQKILALCSAGKARLAEIKRFDMEGFQPPQPYIREMQRYGILPEDLDPEAPIDTYACDRAYWESFRQDIALEHPAYREALEARLR